MKLTIRQRAQNVFQAISRAGKHSLRTIAKGLGLSKSSVHRHRQAIARRNRYPESGLWETQAGSEWLKVLVMATLFVFCFQRGVGCESVHEFFRLLRLEQHIGVSVASLRKIRQQMEEQILAYQAQQQSELSDSQSKTEICASVDETFFDEVVLVMLDVSSGFILVEALAADYRYETWQQHVKQALNQLGLKARYCVSDRAKALVKLALSELGCPSIADLFHALRDLSQGIGWELSQQLSAVNRQLDQLTPSQKNAEQTEPLRAHQSLLLTAQQQYQAIMHRLTTTHHPFALDEMKPLSSAQVQTQLQAQTNALYQLKQIYSLSDSKGSIAKFERQLHDLSALVDLWWNWVQQYLQQCACEPSLQDWLQHQLLPAVYWQQQTHRTKTPPLKALYQKAFEQAQAALIAHPTTATLTADQLNQWHQWAIERVSQFQRTSSAVEGRNGYLSQIHQSQRGLSTRRLQVMTTLHNFHLKRADGTTAAQRLFGKPVPDLFEWLVQHTPELPQARRGKSASKATLFALPTVPA